MSTNWETLASQYHAQPIRLRVLILVAVVSIIFLLFDLFWLSGLDSNIKQTKNNIERVNTEINQLVATQNDVNQNVQRQRNTPESRKLEQLEQQFKALRKQLEDKTLHLVPPKLMTQVLGDIISNTNKLRIMSIAKQPPILLNEDTDTKADKTNDKTKPDNEGLDLYQHNLTMVLEGDYQAAYSFLFRLENMPQKVAFKSVNYRVEDYPKAVIKLTVSTLSLQPEWIGG